MQFTLGGSGGFSLPGDLVLMLSALETSLSQLSIALQTPVTHELSPARPANLLRCSNLVSASLLPHQSPATREVGEGKGDRLARPDLFR